jgi:hypothetical protein
MIFILLTLTATLFLVHDYRCFGWTWFHISHRDYLKWRSEGGAFLEEFNLPLVVDRDRDKLVKGLSYEQIRRKVPNLYDGVQYPKESYKDHAFQGWRETHPETRMLWFHQDDGFDLVIIINRVGSHVELIKG